MGIHHVHDAQCHQDINVELSQGSLILSGQTKFESTSQGGGDQPGQQQEGQQRNPRTMYLRERREARFTRTIPLPTDVDTSKQVNARFDNGILRLDMEKQEGARPRRIDISA
jgi:HSP20 family molecular chaperone IbpA